MAISNRQITSNFQMIPEFSSKLVLFSRPFASNSVFARDWRNKSLNYIKHILEKQHSREKALPLNLIQKFYVY